MPVTQFSRTANESQLAQPAGEAESFNWMRAVASGALIGGGLLLLGGKRRAGLALSVSGAALALVEQPEALRNWWESMPRYMESAGHLIGEVQGAVGGFAAQREKLRDVFHK
jgi:hypothetical protein